MLFLGKRSEKMFSRKGNSLIMWVVVFGVAIAAIAVFQVTVKRALMAKAMGCADYFLSPGNLLKQYMETDRSTSSATIGPNTVDSTVTDTNGSININARIENRENSNTQSLD